MGKQRRRELFNELGTQNLGTRWTEGYNAPNLELINLIPPIMLKTHKIVNSLLNSELRNWGNKWVNSILYPELVNSGKQRNSDRYLGTPQILRLEIFWFTWVRKSASLELLHYSEVESQKPRLQKDYRLAWSHILAQLLRRNVSQCSWNILKDMNSEIKYQKSDSSILYP